MDVVQRRQASRLAKLTFIVTWWCVAASVAVVASAITDPVWGVLGGIAAGFVVAGLVALVVAVWPVLRVLWWWAAEITTGLVLLGGYLGLTLVVPWWAALVLLVVVAGGPWLAPRSRRWLLGWAWCVVSRHRLRSCFALFLRANRYGSLPLMLWARPTPAGERLWVWLRPGLSLEDLTSEGGLARLAVGCWASEVRVARASRRFAGLLRVDLTRRNPLSGTVPSPLVDTVPTDMHGGTSESETTAPVDLSQLDLPGVPHPRPASNSTESAGKGKGGQSRNGDKPSPRPKRANGDRTAGTSAGAADTSLRAPTAAGDDVSDWI